MNTAEGDQVVQATTPVGIYPAGASPFGLLDCAGNVWEWCSTRWEKSYPYDIREDEGADAYLAGTNVRVLRGGSWFGLQNDARCAVRIRIQPYYRNVVNGCRVARVSPI